MSQDRHEEDSIVERHMQAMLDELRAHGIETVGAAGGITLRQLHPNGKNRCHVFFLVNPSYRTGDGKIIDPADFMDDVAKAIIRSRDTDSPPPWRPSTQTRTRARQKAR